MGSWIDLRQACSWQDGTWRLSMQRQACTVYCGGPEVFGAVPSQVGRQADRQTGRPADRQTGRPVGVSRHLSSTLSASLCVPRFLSSQLASSVSNVTRTGVPGGLTPVSQKLWAEPGGFTAPGGRPSPRRSAPLQRTLPAPASAPCGSNSAPAPRVSLLPPKLIAALSTRSQPSAADPP